MEKLSMWKLKVPTNKLMKFKEYIYDIAPYWFLHGVCIVGAELADGSSGIATAIIFLAYAESPSFLSEEIIKDQLYAIDITDESPITPEEYDKAIKEATLQAIKLCMNTINLEPLGEVLLNKHPECRKSSLPEIAIINAALQERKDTFTEEDYEIY